jgi:hypothetical protein
MANLELSLLVGAESKAWLRDVTGLVERLEKVAAKLGSKKIADDEDTDVADEDEDDDFADAPPPRKAKGLKAKSDSFDDEEAGVEAASDDEDEDFTEPSPKKAKKLTSDDVNDACKKRAARTGGKEGRAEVLTILKKKFKTQSVTELKPDTYAAVIAAMNA